MRETTEDNQHVDHDYELRDAHDDPQELNRPNNSLSPGQEYVRTPESLTIPNVLMKSKYNLVPRWIHRAGGRHLSNALP